MAMKRPGGKQTSLVKTSSTSVLAGYDELLRDLKGRIEQAQVSTAVAGNHELVLLYWSVGGHSYLAATARLGREGH